MNFRDLLRSSLRILLQNKVRSFLTMLGIMIGVSAVILIISVGSGAQSLIISQVEKVGSNLIAVFPGNNDDQGPPVSVLGVVITTLTYDDIEAIQKSNRSPHIIAATGYVRGSTTVTWNSEKADTTFVGVSASLPSVEDARVINGDFFSIEDEKTNQRVAVLGSDVARNLFDTEDPIGQFIKIEKQNFRIVGVMAERGAAGFSNQDNQVYIPITTAQSLILGIKHVSFARAKVDSTDNIDAAMDDIHAILQDRHNIATGAPVDFDIRSQKQGAESLLAITNAIKFFLAAVAGIALIVGGIGIMNIMLVSVEERIREIGLRKAIGAKNNDILFQFLIEAIVVTSIAGIFGIILGVGVSFIISVGVKLFGFDNWDFVIPVYSVILGLGVSSVIGLIFGVLPARRASQLNPIEALRYE